MPIQKLILICIIFAATLLGSVLAADKPTAQVDIDKLQEQVRTLDKELAIQREAFVRKLDDVEKRQIEITAQQANSLAAIANQTTSVGNYIANTSIAVTVLLVVAGLITFFNAKSKVVTEARIASAEWFKENAVNLQTQIATLRTEAEKLTAQMQTQANQVTVTATTLQRDMSAAANAVLNVSKASTAGEAAKQADPQAVQVVNNAIQSLKSKPESDFTAADFFTRGLSYFSNQDFHAALAAFDSAIRLSASDTSPDQPAQYLFAKGVTLGQLDKSQDEIAVYDELDKRFGADTTPSVREQVAKGLVSKGFRLGQMDKPQDAIAVYDELDRRFGADTAPAMRVQVARGLFNKGVRMGQLDKSQDAIAVYDELDKRFGADTTPAVREQVAKGLVNKGITLGQLDKSQDAIAVYDELDRRFGADTAPAVREQVATGLVIKGITLQLDKLQDAIAVYDELDRRFGADTTPAVRELVTKGLNGAGFNRILFAKQMWQDAATRNEHLNVATEGLKRAYAQCGKNDKAMILGNLGYSLFLTGQSHAAEEPTLECLRLGGQKALEAQRADAKLHRVEPEDSQYEELLTRLWQSLPPITGAS